MGQDIIEKRYDERLEEPLCKACGGTGRKLVYAEIEQGYIDVACPECCPPFVEPELL